MLKSLNSEQQLAVDCMVLKRNTLPYVLFGPPGNLKVFCENILSSDSVKIQIKIFFGQFTSRNWKNSNTRRCH